MNRKDGVGDDGCDRELPFEAQRQVDHDADDDEAQRHGAVHGQFLADLRTDELAALQRQRVQALAAPAAQDDRDDVFHDGSR